MQRGLEGRRIALYVGSLETAGVAGIRQALEQAGAAIQVLADGAEAAAFHGGLYAALVLVVDGKASKPPDRVVQLVREFMASDKPVALLGGALGLLEAAGGAAGRTIAAGASDTAVLESAGATPVSEPIHADGALITAQGSVDRAEFARTVVREFSEQLEEQAVDETSELSFPASDPPAVSPVTRPVARGEDSGEAR